MILNVCSCHRQHIKQNGILNRKKTHIVSARLEVSGNFRSFLEYGRYDRRDRPSVDIAGSVKRNRGKFYIVILGRWISLALSFGWDFFVVKLCCVVFIIPFGAGNTLLLACPHCPTLAPFFRRIKSSFPPDISIV